MYLPRSPFENHDRTGPVAVSVLWCSGWRQQQPPCISKAWALAVPWPKTTEDRLQNNQAIDRYSRTGIIVACIKYQRFLLYDCSVPYWWYMPRPPSKCWLSSLIRFYFALFCPGWLLLQGSRRKHVWTGREFGMHYVCDERQGSNTERERLLCPLHCKSVELWRHGSSLRLVCSDDAWQNEPRCRAESWGVSYSNRGRLGSDIGSGISNTMAHFFPWVPYTGHFIPWISLIAQ